MQALTQFLHSIQNENTRVAYRCDLKPFVEWFDGNLGRFTADNVENYLAGLAGAPATIARKTDAISTFAKWCMARDLITKDPMRLHSRIRVPRTLPRPFSDDEASRLMAISLPLREQVARALLFYTALRATPISLLKVEDIVWNPPTLTAVVKRSKTQQIPLVPELVEVLRQYTQGMAGYLFKPSNRFTIEEMTNRWGDLAGVKDCTPHRFRHTAATRLLRVTKDLRLVQEFLGHDSIATTQIYTKITQDDLAEGLAGLRF